MSKAELKFAVDVFNHPDPAWEPLADKILNALEVDKIRDLETQTRLFEILDVDGDGEVWFQHLVITALLQTLSKGFIFVLIVIIFLMFIFTTNR